jgi:Rps23 Pro-64 3,4-dihydroxylase Tpa1-like proline 4-hydroxylase
MAFLRDDAQMTQSNLATVRQFQADHVVIRGRTLGFDEILNDAFFSPAKIAELGEAFKRNKPFPHLVIDGLFSPALLECIYEEFDLVKKDELQVYNNMNEKKLATRPFTRLWNASELYFNTINSGRFIDFLQQITGIAGLITDPGLDGGGLHSIPTGGKFALHTDFNQHTVTKLENRLIFITYLNKDWLPSYGGALELWNIEEEKCEAEVFPVFGRSILFHESKRSLHGHPKPVEAPNGRPRRSACTAYYTNGRDDGENTSFHTTVVYKPRNASRREKIMTAVKYTVPPIVVDGFQKLKAWWRK